MPHGGYDKRRNVERIPVNRRSKGLSVQKNKPKAVSLKNQIRSTERILARENLPPEVKDAQQKKLEGLKKQQDLHSRLALEKKHFLRDRKIRFFERRKIERRLRRLEKQLRTSSGQVREEGIAQELSRLKEDLEYVKFFPKSEKYVSLLMGGDDMDTVDRRNKLRKQIKDNIVAAVASGKDLEETGSEDDGLLDMSEDDFFLAGSSSDEADADDEWTDKSAKEQVSSASGKATSGMSSDEKNQRQIPARVLMRPPRPLPNSFTSSVRGKSRFEGSSSKNSSVHRADMSTFTNGASSSRIGSSRKNPSVHRAEMPTFTYGGASSSRIGSSSEHGDSSNLRTGNSSNLSSNSDAHKPRRKRRPKKKKQQ